MPCASFKYLKSHYGSSTLCRKKKKKESWHQISCQADREMKVSVQIAWLHKRVFRLFKGFIVMAELISDITHTYYSFFHIIFSLTFLLKFHLLGRQSFSLFHSLRWVDACFWKPPSLAQMKYQQGKATSQYGANSPWWTHIKPITIR